MVLFYFIFDNRMAGSAAVYAKPCRGDVELLKERKGDSQEQSKL
jgi:hypothetical protein